MSFAVAGSFLARRNLRLGRGDRRGAVRLAGFVLVFGILYWALSVDHAPTLSEVGILFDGLAANLLVSAIVWLFYIAVEPYVRRRWPEALISWTRLLSGRWRDPRVGREVLVGALAGLLMTYWAYLVPLAMRWLGQPGARPIEAALDSLAGYRFAASGSFFLLLNGFANAVGSVLLLLLLRTILRRDWIAVGVFVLWPALWFQQFFPGSWIPWVTGAVIGALFAFLLLRFGLIALTSSLVFSNLDMLFVSTPDLSSWYAGRFVLVFLVFACLVGCAFYISLAGRPLIRARLLEG